jgi:hypothetical protein
MRARRLTTVILATTAALVPLAGVAEAAKAPVHLTVAKTASVIHGPLSLRPAGFKLDVVATKKGSLKFWLCAGAPAFTLPTVGYSYLGYSNQAKTNDVFVTVMSMTSTAAAHAMLNRIAASQPHCRYVRVTNPGPNLIRRDTFKVGSYTSGDWQGLRVVDHVSWQSNGKHVGHDFIGMSTILWRGNALLEIDRDAAANPPSTVGDTAQARLLHNLAVAGV